MCRMRKLILCLYGTAIYIWEEFFRVKSDNHKENEDAMETNGGGGGAAPPRC
jgi:hypothetical protein